MGVRAATPPTDNTCQYGVPYSLYLPAPLVHIWPGQGGTGKGGRYAPPPPPGHPAYAQPLSP